jgi:hypothetical protein
LPEEDFDILNAGKSLGHRHFTVTTRCDHQKTLKTVEYLNRQVFFGDETAAAGRARSKSEIMRRWLLPRLMK